MYPVRMRDIVKQYIAALNAHDLEAIAQIYDQNAIVEDPVGSEPHRGLGEIIELYTLAFFQNVSAELAEEVRIASNFAAFSYSVSLRPEGRAFKLNVIDTFEFNDAGKVAAMKAYWGPENLSKL